MKFEKVMESVSDLDVEWHPDWVGELSKLSVDQQFRLVISVGGLGVVVRKMGVLAKRQLFSRLGVNPKRYRDWLDVEMAMDVSTSLSKMKARVRVRAQGGYVRAILDESLSPISDLRVFRALEEYAGGVVQNCRFVHVDRTEEASYFVVGDDTLGEDLGWVLRTSEVGCGAVTIDSAWFLPESRDDARILLKVMGTRVFYRTHRPIQDVKLGVDMLAGLVAMKKELPRLVEKVQEALRGSVKHPADAVVSVMDESWIPKKMQEEALELVAEKSPTRMSVVQSIAEVAARSESQEVGFMVACKVGDYACHGVE